LGAAALELGTGGQNFVACVNHGVIFLSFGGLCLGGTKKNRVFSSFQAKFDFSGFSSEAKDTPISWGASALYHYKWCRQENFQIFYPKVIRPRKRRQFLRKSSTFSQLIPSGEQVFWNVNCRGARRSVFNPANALKEWLEISEGAKNQPRINTNEPG